MRTELVIFISHIFNEFTVDRYNDIKYSLLENQELIWCYTGNPPPNFFNHNKIIKTYKFNPPVNYRDPNNKNLPNNSYLFVDIYNKYNMYEYYWMIEYDVTINSNDYNPFEQLFRYYNTYRYEQTADVIADHINTYITNHNYVLLYNYNMLKRLYHFNSNFINEKDITFGFLTICRFSNNFLKHFSKSNDWHKFYFEWGILTFANKNNYRICTLHNTFSTENYSQLFTYTPYRKINDGSNSPHPNNNKIGINDGYPLGCIIHHVKSYNVQKEKINEQYNMISKENKVWICGFNIPRQFNKNLTYNCFNPKEEYSKHNINKLNRFWSEFVCQYYVYKNNIYSKVISFCHDTRIIQATKIKENEILDKDIIQCYYIVKTNMTNEYDYLGNKIPKIEEVPHREFRNIYYEIVSKMNQPEFMYNDFIEYLTTQNIVPIENIINITSTNDYNFITREMYTCIWNRWIDMMKFVCGYYEFIIKKYSLNIVDDYYKHFINRIIPHYRNLKPENYTPSKILYMQPHAFNEINNPKTKYGLNAQCNVWRCYSYHIEILISLYILTHNNIYTTNCIL